VQLLVRVMSGIGRVRVHTLLGKSAASGLDVVGIAHRAKMK